MGKVIALEKEIIMNINQIVNSVSIVREITRENIRGKINGCRLLVTFYIDYEADFDYAAPIVKGLAEIAAVSVRQSAGVEVLTDSLNHTVSIDAIYSLLNGSDWLLAECAALRDAVLYLTYQYGWLLLSDGYTDERRLAA